MRRLLSGNEALARGAWEAGAAVGAGYPGTPSTEILESFAPYPDVYAEWSPNEKVALDVAIGAAYAGRRAFATMKHVGLNVAADSFWSVSMTGIEAGLVVVSADDPSLHSSQNEQDNRHFARWARVPCLDPTDAQDSRDLVMAGFDLSERFDTPVLLRTTTRVCHTSSPVEVGELRRTMPVPSSYVRNVAKYDMAPANARARRPVLEQRIEALTDFAETFALNRVELRGRQLGIVTSGVAYHYAREVFPEASTLKLGMVYPLPRKLIASFAAQVDALIVLEELDPFVEDQLRLMGIPLYAPPVAPVYPHTKSIFPLMGELDPAAVRTAARAAGLLPDLAVELVPAAPGYAVGSALVGSPARAPFDGVSDEAPTAAGEPGNGAPTAAGEPGNGAPTAPGEPGNGAPTAPGEPGNGVAARHTLPVLDIAPRPPILCPGCPHRSSFYVLHKLGVTVNGDIGCYTLGMSKPLDALHTAGCMGASIGVAHGGAQAGDGGRHVAVIGDSTFFHSGIPALVNVLYNRSNVVTVIMDNRITGMTGHQDNPGSGHTLQRQQTLEIDIERVVRSLGFPDDKVVTIPSYDVKALESQLKRWLKEDGPAVLITKQECALLPTAKAAYLPLSVNDNCNGCTICFRIGCPAILKSDELDERTHRPLAVIDQVLCTGCEICAQVCPRDAILFREQVAARV